MNAKRIHRLVRLLGELHSGKAKNTRELAEACDVSRRTIFRDLEALRVAGVPLQYDEERQHYFIPGSYFLPPTNFTTEEALAVLVLCHEIGNREQPFYNAARSAAVKLENSLPPSMRDHLRELTDSFHIQFESYTPLSEKQTVYHQVADALASRRAVRIEYESFTDDECQRTKLSPYKLLFNRHSWYVIGRSSLHRTVRTFNLRRIKRVETLEDVYHVPRGFTLQRYLGKAWNLMPGPEFDVCIRFSYLVGRNVAEVRWHATQTTEVLDDGSVEFRCRVAGLQEIAWWVLGYGDEAEVIEPQELREEICRRAKNMLEKYEAASGKQKRHG